MADSTALSMAKRNHIHRRSKFVPWRNEVGKPPAGKSTSIRLGADCTVYTEGAVKQQGVAALNLRF